MKQINENTLMVPVTIETYLSKIQDICPKLMIKYKNGDEKFVRLIDLPYGNWQILGEITEYKCTFDVEGLVEGIRMIDGRVFDIGESNLWKNYSKPFSSGSDAFWNNPIDSFRSLLNSHGLFFVNPYGDEPNEDDYDRYPLPIEFDERAEAAAFWKRKKIIEDDWQIAQSNTFPKYLVLRKINNF